MKFLGKKEEFDEELDEEELERNFPSNRSFKDLKSENRKKRREPPFVWGRKERFVLLFVLFVTIFSSGVLAASARDWKLPGFPRIKVSSLSLNSSLNPFKEETIIIGNKNGKIDDNNKEKSEKVVKDFKDATKNLSGTYGLYVVRLDEGLNYGVYENELFIAASLVKLPVIATLYKEVEKGSIGLDTKYILKDSDKISGSGSLQYKKAGSVFTYRQLVELMGKQSDNTAFRIIKKVLGDEKINRKISEIGMTQTSLTDNKTSPYDIGLFFKKLWNKEIVSEKSRDVILASLTDTIYENWLVAGVPKEIKVAHKYGREIHVVNDAGIVFAKNPYVVVVLTKGVVEREADEVFPKLSKIIYERELLK